MASDLAPLVSGAVGLLGVVVGLTGELLRRRWQQPNLELLPYVPNLGDSVYFDLFTVGTHAVYARLRVRNSGRDVARNVEVCIEDVWLLDTEPDILRMSAFQRQAIEGLIGRRLKWADRDEALIDIPPGTVRRVDIVNVHTSAPNFVEEESGALAVPLRITLNKQSEIYRNVLAGLSYEIQISLTASNSKTRQFKFVLRFGGRWMDHDTLSTDCDGALRLEQISPL